jgi:hypothetical protein
MTKVVLMSSQSQHTNLCKTCFNVFLLIKVSRPDQHTVRARVSVYRIHSNKFDGLCEIQFRHYAVEAIPVTYALI